MLRDPRYLLPLALLVAVVVISFAAGRGNTHAQTGGHARVPIVTPSAQSTPDDAAIDARRASDLQRLSDALIAMRELRGAYPTTGNTIMQTCGAPGDAGCVLAEVTPDLAFTDNGEPYYYASDGERYVLMVRMKVASNLRECPVGLPAELVAGPLICIASPEAN